MALRELLAHFGFEFDHGDLKKGHNEIEKLKKMTEKTVEVIAEAFAIHEISEFVKETIESAAAVKIQSEQLGIGVEKMQLLREAAEETGGSAEGLTATMRVLSQHVQNAREKGGDAAKAFTDLGISGEDLKSLSLDQLFLKVGDTVGGIEDPTKRAAKAAELFGRGGLASLSFFKEGKGAAEDLLKELEEVGGGFSEDFAESAHEAEVAGKRFEFAWTRVKSNALQALLPVITFVGGKLTWFAGEINKLTKGTHFWEAALLTLGAVGTAVAIRMLVTWLPVIAPFLAWGVAILAVALILDDLITLFKGGDSAIGRFIDKMFGVGASKKFVEDVKKAFEDFKVELGQATQFAKDHAGQAAIVVALYVDYKIAVGAVTAAKWALNAALVVVKAAQVAHNAAMAAGQVVMELFTRETWGAVAAATGLDAGLAPLLVTLGALALVIGSVVALYQQLKALSAETGGLGLSGTVTQMVKQGTWDPFKAVDTYQNQQARLAAGQPAGGGPTSNTVNGAPVNVTINAPGQDAAAIGQHAARALGNTMRQERRAALHSLDHR